MFASTVLSKIGYQKAQKKIFGGGKVSNLGGPQPDLCQLNNTTQHSSHIYVSDGRSGEGCTVAPPLPPRSIHELQGSYLSPAPGCRGDVPLPGATPLQTHSAKFPIEREVILTSTEKESAKIPILTEYMRKTKPAAVAPDAPNIHLAWVNKSMENLASHSGMNPEVPPHQVYKAEPMALVDSIGSEPSPIRAPGDLRNTYSENGIVTSTPEDSSKGGFPSRTYHSIKDMISSRFSSHKEKTAQPSQTALTDANNTSLSPQSQLRQHGVYMGASSSAHQDPRLVSRGREAIYQTPPYRGHHHPQQTHQPQVHAPPAGMQETSFREPYRDPYRQDDWTQHHADIHMHNQQQQLRINGAYGPPPRPPYNGHPLLSHHQPPHHPGQQLNQQGNHQAHQTSNYSPVLRPSGPHMSPMVVHRPPHSRPPSQGPPQALANKEETRSDIPDHALFLAKDLGRNSPQIYQLGKPPELGRISPTHQPLYQVTKQNHILQHSHPPIVPATNITEHTKTEIREPQVNESQTKEMQSRETPGHESQTSGKELNNKESATKETDINGSDPASTKRLQPCGQESSDPQTDIQEPKDNSVAAMPPPPEPKKTEPKSSKALLDQEDDDEGGFVKAGVQTDSGRGSTIYSSTKTKPSPEPGTSNGGVGEWADLVETELRNILGPSNAVNSNSLSESVSSVSPPLAPLSPTHSSDELNFRSSRKGSRYDSKSQGGGSNWRKSQHRLQNTGAKLSKNMPSSSLEIDSMLDENNSSDDDLDYTDVRAIRKQLEGLETMYSQVLKLLGVKKHGSRYDPGPDSRVHKRRICGSVSSVPSSVSSRPIRDKRREFKHKVRDMKGINKRFQRLESHVVTLARSVAHLSSEMRTQHLMLQEMEVIRSELASIRLAAQATRHSSPAKPTPDKVKKLTKFFGDEPPLLRLFLKQLGYEKYAPMFEKERIGLVELPYLTEERLHKLGIPLGPRLRIMQQAQFALATQHPNTLCIV